MALTLKDDKNGMVSVLTDERFNLRDLVPGAAGVAPRQTNNSSFVIGQIAPVTQPGQYTVFISVGQRDGTPKISLPLPENDGQRRYRLGQITLNKP